MYASPSTGSKGLTLIETLIASSIFLIISIGMYQLYTTVLDVARTIRAKTILAELTGEQMEFIRNLQYSDVGTISGIPAGVVPQNQIITRNGMTFALDISIRSIDHPADGTLEGNPNDLSPADNKLVQIDAICTSCSRPAATSFSSLVAPKNLETENGNGALVIKAVDANGQPLAGADVAITNTTLSPAVSISDSTNANGVLTIVDAPPAVQSYKIVVSKSGYSTDQSYQPGDVGNPTPIKPNLTVSANKITQSTFAIDRVSTLNIKTQSAQCSSLGSISGTLIGTKLIGTPSVIKNNISFTTDGTGVNTKTGIDWDTYTVSLGGATYTIAGTNPVAPIAVSPNTTQNLTLTLKTGGANRLVVAVVDSAGLPIADALVSIDGPSGVFSANTSIGSVTQTDWSDGSGQSQIGSWSRFFSSDGGIDTATTSGLLRLVNAGSAYVSSGELESSTIDFGDNATFRQLIWSPQNQPSGIGAIPVRFQIATNTDNTTWNFLGPDGTAGSYYSATPADIAAVHTGDRYLRYKLFLSTTDASKTPSITDVAFTYSAGCLPPGQVDFGGLSNGTYDITVSKSGFATVDKAITISGNTYDTTTLIP